MAVRRAVDRRQLPRLHDPRADPLVRASRAHVGLPARGRAAYELPRHVSQDTIYPHGDGASATVRDIRCGDAGAGAGAGRPILVASAEIALHRSSEVTLGTFELLGHLARLAYGWKARQTGALAADDPAAPWPDRPDHGAAGAFCAWPGVTAHGLAALGRRDLAARLLGVVHLSASGGLWGQAMEIVSDERGQRVRVAEDGASNRDSIGAVATAEAVVSGLFGFEPAFTGLTGDRLPDGIEVPGVRSLVNINVGRACG